MNPDGTLDDTFGGDGIVTHHSASNSDQSDSGNAIAVDGNGKILVTGISCATTPPSCAAYTNITMALWRYNSNGTLDTEFDTDGYLTHSIFVSNYGKAVHTIDIDGQEKIVVIGDGWSAGTTYDTALWLFNANGSADDTILTTGTGYFTWGSGGTAIDLAFDGIPVFVGGEWKYLVAGFTYGGDGWPYMRTWRFNQNGGLDTANFGTSGIVSFDTPGEVESPRGIAVDSAGNIIIVGYTTVGKATPPADYLATIWRTDGSGNEDTSFGVDGKWWRTRDGGYQMDGANAVAIDSQERIVVVGESENADGDRDLLVLRYNVDGTPDENFGTNGVFTHHSAAGGINSFDYGNDVAIDALDRIVVTGTSQNSNGDTDMVVWRIKP